MKQRTRRTMLFAGALVVSVTVPTAVTQAQQQGNLMDSISEYMTKENVGKAVGGILGGVLGSQIGHGSGKTAATIVGALAGYMIGGEVGSRMQESDRDGLAVSTATAIQTGQPQTWSNPDTGVRTEVRVEEARPMMDTGSSRMPALEMINQYYVAKGDSHVRAGPGTNYPIVGLLLATETVPVVGRVIGEDWYMVSQGGRGHGYVYAPLLVRADRQPADSNAIRADAGSDLGGAQLAQPECTLVTQKVTMPDGRSVSEQFRACQTADGSWEVV